MTLMQWNAYLEIGNDTFQMAPFTLHSPHDIPSVAELINELAKQKRNFKGDPAVCPFFSQSAKPHFQICAFISDLEPGICGGAVIVEYVGDPVAPADDLKGIAK